MAAQQHRQPTDLLEASEQAFVEREGSPDRDDAGECAGMAAGDPECLRATAPLADEEDPPRMNRDAVADPIDRLPDERLAVGVRAVRAARFHGHVIAETDAAHRPSQIESRPMRVGQPDEERIGVPRLIPGGDEHSLCADRCRCGGAPFPSCRRARADGPCRRERRRDRAVRGSEVRLPVKLRFGRDRAGGEAGTHAAPQVGTIRSSRGREAPWRTRNRGGSNGTPTVASTADSPPDRVPLMDRPVGGAGAFPGP